MRPSLGKRGKQQSLRTKRFEQFYTVGTPPAGAKVPTWVRQVPPSDKRVVVTPGDAAEGVLDRLLSIEPRMEVTDRWQPTISQTLIYPSDERAPERCDGACPTDKVTIEPSHIYVERMAGESGNVRELSAIEGRVTPAW